MDGPRSRGYRARSGYDVRTRRLRGGPEGRDGVNCGVHTKDAIHSGMRSSDICCSMAVSVFADTNPTEILDAAMKCSHMATCRSSATCRSYGALYAQGFELLRSDTPHLVLVIDEHLNK